MESGAIAVKNQMIDTEAKTYTDFSTGETMTIQEAVNKKLIEAEISEHVERKPLGLSMQNAIRLGFYVAETGTNNKISRTLEDLIRTTNFSRYIP
jgi:hypothetical protein